MRSNLYNRFAAAHKVEMHSSPLSRREFIVGTAGLISGALCNQAAETTPEPVIDIHQHTTYGGRTNDQLIAHQKMMGVTHTVLLPAGRLYGLDAGCGRNDTVVELSGQRPSDYSFFANEIPDIPEARFEIEKYLRQGGIGIGEQKFRVACDSPAFHLVAEIAREYGVPVLMHFMHDRYNTGIERMHKTLEKFPDVNFIGHAQTWWGNVDKLHKQEALYPKTKVIPGGITDRLLSDYPNMFGDLSAGSGLNFFTRDEEHARGFLRKHQDKLMFGSDCDDKIGRGEACQGAQIMTYVRRFSPDNTAERKLLYENARRVLKLS